MARTKSSGEEGVKKQYVRNPSTGERMITTVKKKATGKGSNAKAANKAKNTSSKRTAKKSGKEIDIFEISSIVNKPVKTADIPDIIDSGFGGLDKLRKKAESSKRKADKALTSAEEAKKVKVTILRGKKEAIEALQDATVDIAEAEVDLTEAQRLSFQFQEKLARMMQALCYVGMQSITANRCIVKELTMRLQNASKKELDEMARQEMLLVIKQLKDQEDVYVKMKNMENKLKKNEEEINFMRERLDSMETIVNGINKSKEKKRKAREKKNEGIDIGKETEAIS